MNPVGEINGAWVINGSSILNGASPQDETSTLRQGIVTSSAVHVSSRPSSQASSLAGVSVSVSLTDERFGRVWHGSCSSVWEALWWSNAPDSIYAFYDRYLPCKDRPSQVCLSLSLGIQPRVQCLRESYTGLYAQTGLYPQIVSLSAGACVPVSGDATPCKVTPVILHGVVSPERRSVSRCGRPRQPLSHTTYKLNGLRKSTLPQNRQLVISIGGK